MDRTTETNNHQSSSTSSSSSSSSTNNNNNSNNIDQHLNGQNNDLYNNLPTRRSSIRIARFVKKNKFLPHLLF